MFDSGISADSLVSDLKSEIDVAYDIPDRSYIFWINLVEQLLYSEIIQEQRYFISSFYDLKNSTIPLGITYNDNEDAIRFEDIYAVYAYDSDRPETQLIKTTVASGFIFNNCYYKSNNDLVFRTNPLPDFIRVIYFVRPKLKTIEAVTKTITEIVDGEEVKKDVAENVIVGNIALPIEFVDIIKTKIRGEVCKIANEDAVAAKWLNDYNILVETFKTWVQNKNPQFGM